MDVVGRVSALSFPTSFDNPAKEMDVLPLLFATDMLDVFFASPVLWNVIGGVLNFNGGETDARVSRQSSLMSPLLLLVLLLSPPLLLLLLSPLFEGLLSKGFNCGCE